MPTSHCNFPSHHGPSAGPPFALLAAIVVGAVVIGFFHAVVVALVVVTILAAIAGGVMLLIHAAHAEPYDSHQDTAADVEQRITAQVGQAMLTARLEQLERDTVRDRVAAIEQQQTARNEIERAVALHAIQQHQKQLDAIEAAAVERQAIPAPAWFESR